MSYKTIINDLKFKTHLNLNNKNIEEENVKSLAEALKDTQITLLELAKNNIRDGGTKYLAQVLKNTNITNLILSENNIGNEGVKYLAHVLKDTKITDLSLSKNNIGDEGVKYLAHVLKDTKITDLNLSKNNIGNEGVKYLSHVLKDTKITNLDLSENNIGDEGAICLAQVLKDTQIIQFNLCENNIGPDAAQCLTRVVQNTKFNSLCFDVHYTEDLGDNYISQSSYYEKIDIRFYGNKIGTNGAKYINQTFQNIPIADLTLDQVELEADDVQYLAQALKDKKIITLKMHGLHIMQNNGIKYLVEAFKDSHIVKLDLVAEKIRTTGAKYLAEFLKEIKIIKLNLNQNYIGDEGVKYLAPVLKNNTIIDLDLAWNDVGVDGAKYLAQILKSSQITFISLCNNDIGVDGSKYLANGLKYSQVTGIHLHGNGIKYEGYQYLLDVVDDTNISWVNLHGNSIEEGLEEGTKLWPYSIPRRTTPVEFEICNAFKELVSLNPISNEFEFIVPKKDTSIDVDQYIFLIKTLNQTPIVKVHIFNMMCRDDDDISYDFNIMHKINEFITVLSNKFNTFINHSLPVLVELFDDYNYENLVKEFEDMKLYDIVQNLLLHRELYYIDDSQEILHPYIYKMLYKYNMILYNKQLEPNKKQEIISYYQNHSEIEGVQEMIDLLSSESFQ